MKITANYPGTCKRCEGELFPGQEIEWTRSGGATHLTVQRCAAYWEERTRFEEANAAEAREQARQAFLATPCERPSEALTGREYAEAWAEYNCEHGLCPDGCCGEPKACGRGGCAYEVA